MRTSKRILAMVVALCMIAVLLPVVANAQTMTFSTYEEMLELLNNRDYDYISAIYEGSEPLVIREDLVLHEDFLLHSFTQPIIVPEGVTLTVKNTIDADSLTINGTLKNSGAALFISSELIINGTLEAGGKVQLDVGGTLIGAENMVFGRNGYFTWRYDIHNDVPGLKSALADAAAETNPNYTYEIHYYGGETVFDSDLYVPSNTWMTLSGDSITVPQSRTLTIDGNIDVWTSLIIEGSLVNNGMLGVDCYDPNMLCTLTIAASGRYSGTGDIYLWGTVDDVQSVLPGMDLSYFTSVVQEYDYWWLTIAEVGPEGGGEIETTFDSFEMLQALCEEATYNPNFIYATYNGSKPLVINKNLTIPSNLIIFCYNYPVTVTSGITLTIDGALYTANLIVNSTIINYGVIYAAETLTINGAIENYYVIQIENAATVTGGDNITYHEIPYEGKPAQLHIIYYPESVSELKSAVADAQASTDPYTWYAIYYYGPENNVLTEDMTTPNQSVLSLLESKVTIAEGCTLTTDGAMEVWYMPLTVEGTLVNNKRLELNPELGGSLNIGKNGSYEGTGEIWIWCYDESIAKSAVSGLDINAFDMEFKDGGYWCLTPKTEEHVHSWGEGVVTDATCTADGVKTYTCSCGEAKTEVIPATGHTEVIDAARDATCTAVGLTEGSHCSSCNAVLTAQNTIPALGHDYVDGFCTRCGRDESAVLPGDANSDGVVDNVDAMLILQYAVGLNNGSNLDLAVCDVDGNGTVDNVDAMMILQHAVGLLPEFPGKA